ncbi:MAG TPA: SGNH/GDSL hydrolase family protein [Verrucomicrobiae bacterium]|nr:SGNH/GDSL hydrolase family protein [Verrucomicrobiae bacterium]
MKRRILTFLLTGAFIGLAGLSARAQLKIMPFGDSVTANGSSPESSYRYWLYQYLVNAGFDVDFIGPESGVADGSPANSDFDQNYAGGDGMDSSSALFYMQQRGLATYNGGPDVVLLDMGANDFNTGQKNRDILAQTKANLEQIVENFYAANPNVIIILAESTPWVALNGRKEKNFMSHLKGIQSQVVSAEKRAGVKIMRVNLWAGFNPRKDTKDGTHPNLIGEKMIAKKYFNKFKNNRRLRPFWKAAHGK